MNRYLFQILFVIAFVFAAAWMHEPASAKIASDTSLTRISFDYEKSADGTEMIPYVGITTIEYDTGKRQYEKILYPEFAYKLPKNVELGSKADGGHYMKVRSAGGYSITEINGGLKAYWVDFVIETIEVKKEVNSMRSSSYTYPSDGKERLFEFDFKTKKIKLIKSITTPKSYPYSRIMVYSDFKGYVIQTADRETNFRNNDVEIYSLLTNKLIKRVAENPYPNFGSANGGPYDRIPVREALRIKEFTPTKEKVNVFGISYGRDKSNDIFAIKHYELFHDGRQVELNPNPNSETIRWSKKIGSITYAMYRDTKLNAWRIGYSKNGGAFVPYTSVNSSYLNATWSPSNKYFIITETGIDPETQKKTAYQPLTIVDATTGKVIRQLPMLEPFYTEFRVSWYSDDLAYITFHATNFSLDRYLHIHTGITTVLDSSNGSGAYNRNTSYFKGSLEQFISPEEPAILHYNGVAMINEAQGPFQVKQPGNEKIWYVQLRETARFLGAAVSADSKGWTVTKGSKKHHIGLEQALTIQKRVFVPLTEMLKPLQMNIAVAYSDKSILLFSKDYTEEQFLSTNEGMKPTVQDGHKIEIVDYKNGKWHKVPQAEAEKMNQYVWNYNVNLVFQDGKLHSLATRQLYRYNPLRSGADGFKSNDERQIAADYGTPVKQTINNQQWLTYEFEDTIMAYMLEKGRLRNIHFRVKQ